MIIVRRMLGGKAGVSHIAVDQQERVVDLAQDDPRQSARNQRAWSPWESPLTGGTSRCDQPLELEPMILGRSMTRPSSSIWDFK
jgi:hypothetical protein